MGHAGAKTVGMAETVRMTSPYRLCPQQAAHLQHHLLEAYRSGFSPTHQTHIASHPAHYRASHALPQRIADRSSFFT